MRKGLASPSLQGGDGGGQKKQTRPYKCRLIPANPREPKKYVILRITRGWDYGYNGTVQSALLTFKYCMLSKQYRGSRLTLNYRNGKKMSNPERWLKFTQLPADIHAKLEHLPVIFEQHGVELVYLFGYLARGEIGKDVDLAILTQAEPAFRLRAEIIECLDTERLDLVDLRRASPSLRFEVISTGRMIYCTDQITVERFEIDTLHQYRDTAYLRAQQMEDLRKRVSL